jgi:hypothetical protein
VSSVCLASLIVSNLFWALLFSYARRDFGDLRFLASEPSVTEIIRRFGEPEEVFAKGDVILGRGWPVPARPVTNKVLVYGRRTGTKLFIFVDGGGVVEYVFASTS